MPEDGGLVLAQLSSSVSRDPVAGNPLVMVTSTSRSDRVTVDLARLLHDVRFAEIAQAREVSLRPRHEPSAELLRLREYEWRVRVGLVSPTVGRLVRQGQSA